MLSWYFGWNIICFNSADKYSKKKKNWLKTIDNIWSSDLFFQLLLFISDIQKIYWGYLKHIISENEL